MSSSRPLLVMVSGAAPGIGKSSLARGLRDHLVVAGIDTELFEEREIWERPEFASVIEEWQSTGLVTNDALLSGTTAYLNWCLSRGASVYVLDSLLPFLPSLLAWGRSDAEIQSFFTSLNPRLDSFNVLQFQIEGSAHLALRRAAVREGENWLEWFVNKVRAYSDEASGTRDAQDVVSYLERATARSHLLLTTAPWSVWFLDAEKGPDAALEEIVRQLHPHLSLR